MMGPGGLKQVYRLLIMLDLRFFLDLYHFYMTDSSRDESSVIGKFTYTSVLTKVYFFNALSGGSDAMMFYRLPKINTDFKNFVKISSFKERFIVFLWSCSSPIW